MTLAQAEGFGGWLRERRKALDLTQRELAQRVGCSFETIRSLETHRSRPSKQIAERLGLELGVSQIYLEPLIAASRRGLAPEFNEIKTPQPIGPVNLPSPPTAFLGRAHESEAVLTRLLLPQVRLLTLVGPPGIGKTRLSIKVASDAAPMFPDGVFFIELAPLQDAELVLPAIGHAVGLQDAAPHEQARTLHDFIRHKTLLFVLDNFEHVLDAAELVGKVLLPASRVKILATTRERLNIYGEHVYAVPPLSSPDPADLPPLDELRRMPAVQLFVERAQAARFDFELTNEDAEAVATICHQLEGLPLALELAAARLESSTPQHIVGALADRLSLLQTTVRDLPDRQRTMRGAIEWSFALLDADKQRLLRQLAVFVGGFTSTSAAAVADSIATVDDAIATLLNKSLLSRTGLEPNVRLAMLEVIRQYALEDTCAADEWAAVRSRHAAHFLAVADQAEPELTGAAQAAWLDRLELEHANLRAALAFLSGSERPEEFARMSASLWRFWITRGYLREGLAWLEKALLQAESISSNTHIKLLNGAGSIARDLGAYGRAQELHQACLHLRESVGDQLGAASSTTNLANVALELADYQRAQALYRQSLDYFRQCGDTWRMAIALNGLGLVARQLGDSESANAAYEECLSLRRSRHDEWGIALTLANLGEVARDRRELGKAVSFFRDSLQRFERLGDRQYLAMGMEGVATVSLLEGQAVRAAQLFGAADALRDLIAAPVKPADRAEYAAWLEALRALLGERAFTGAWLLGRAMSLERALLLTHEK